MDAVVWGVARVMGQTSREESREVVPVLKACARGIGSERAEKGQKRFKSQAGGQARGCGLHPGVPRKERRKRGHGSL